MRNGLALTLLCLSLLASSALAQGIETNDMGGAYVRVSREEVRVYFPPERSSAWGGSSVPAAAYRLPLMWTAALEGLGGSARLAIRFYVDSGSRTLPSLETIVREGRRDFCRVGMLNGACSSADVSASVEERRIVLRYRDTAEIRRIFGLRPVTVPLLKYIPEYLDDVFSWTPAVHYVDPPIVVDSAQRVALVKEQRQREASVNSYSRSLEDYSHRRPLWVVVGDSIWPYIEDHRCFSDLCGTVDYIDAKPRNWGRWTLSDSSLATLHVVTLKDPYERPSDEQGRGMTLVGVRPGRLKVRATGVHTPADTVPSGTPVDTILEATVIVTQPVAKLAISPRPTSMVVGSPMAFTARVLDRFGRTIEGPAVWLRWDTWADQVTSSLERVTVTFTQPGRHWIGASLGTYTDSLTVDVQPAPRR